MKLGMESKGASRGPFYTLRPWTDVRPHGVSQWFRRLPVELLDRISEPVSLEPYEEYEMDARRYVGFDATGVPCFTSHVFHIMRPASDDDVTYYEVACFKEEMAAWRLPDNRWLVFRLVENSSCTSSEGTYTLSDTMPR